MPVTDFYAEIDANLARTVAHHGVACTACVKPTCCNQRLFAYTSECEAVARLIEDDEPAKARLRRWVETFMVLPRKAQLDADAYFALRRACPFLLAGRCGIYADRPVACRMHFSFEKTPDACDPDVSGKGARVMQLDTSHLHSIFMQMDDNTTYFALGVLACLEPDTLLGRQARALDVYLWQELQSQP